MVAGQIERIEKQIQEKNQEVVRLASLHTEKSAYLNEMKTSLKTKRREIESIERLLHTEYAEARETAKKHNQTQRELISLEEDRASLLRSQKIEEIYKKQVSFIEARPRIQHYQNLFHNELVGITTRKSPDEVLSVFESHISNIMSRGVIGELVREARRIYDANIYQVCEMVVDGKKISPAVKSKAIDGIDTFLNKPHIQEIWT